MAAIFPPDQEVRAGARFFRPARAGYFVEVGANDPKENSQSFHLEQAGWSGILVEPQPDLADELRNAAHVQGLRGGLLLARPRRHARCSCTCSGRFRRSTRRWPSPGCARSARSMCRSARSTTFSNDAHAPRAFDLLSVDVEGHELDVLRGFDFGRWRPRLILLEDHVNNLDQAPLPHPRRLSPDAPHRIERLVRPARAMRRGSTCGGAGRSCANIIWRCRSGCCVMRGADCATDPLRRLAGRMTSAISAIVITQERGTQYRGLSRQRRFLRRTHRGRWTKHR